MGNFWKNLGYFLFKHLVTLHSVRLYFFRSLLFICVNICFLSFQTSNLATKKRRSNFISRWRHRTATSTVRKLFFFKSGPNKPLLFFLLLKHKFYCGLQRFSNWDRHSTRQDGWPLDHHLGPNTLIFVSTSIRHFSPESFYASNDGKWPINQRSFHARVGHSVIRVPALWNILL